MCPRPSTRPLSDRPATYAPQVESSPTPSYLSWAVRVLGGYLVLLAVASALPAAKWADETTWHGWEFLFIGPLGIFQSQFGWYANSFVVAAVVMLIIGHRGIARVLATLAAVTATNTFTLYSTGTLVNENGDRTDLVGLQIGAWVWMAAIAWAVAFIWLAKPAERSDTPVPQSQD